MMKNNCAIDQTELETLSGEFADEALEIAALAGGENVGNITLYYCTALYFRTLRGNIMMMVPRTLTLLSLLIVALAVGPSVAAERASKEEAIAMVKRAVIFIKGHGPEKAYAEITNKAGQFHDRDL